jgi:hypothetical protein
MYILLECATCILLILAAAVLLFVVGVGLLLIEEGALQLTSFFHAFLRRQGQPEKTRNTVTGTGSFAVSSRGCSPAPSIPSLSAFSQNRTAAETAAAVGRVLTASRK